jgi:hypothetical protein
VLFVDQSRGCQDGSSRAVEAGAVRVQGAGAEGASPPGTPTPLLGTTTPSRPRLHRRPNVSTAAATLTSFPPWSLPGCSGGVETRHQHIEPQNCHPAMGPISWATHAPEFAVVVR